MTWKRSPLSSLWLTSAPWLLRAVRGTQHHRPGLPKWAAQVPSLRTARKRRKRIVATKSRTPPLWSWQLRLGAGATAANVHGHRGVTAAHAPMHPNGRHSAAECREIIDLAKRVSARRKQSSGDGSPPRCRPGKERDDDEEVATAEPDLRYQSPEGVLKDVFTGGSNSGEGN
jgi:hypothetical protein